MPKINRWFSGFFLAVLWPGLLLLHAREPSSDTVSSQKVVFSASETATPGIDSAVQMAQEEVRDPFAIALPPEMEVPKIAQASAGSQVKVELQGIGFGSKDAYAIIGGEIFYKGDEKGGIKLLEVRRREVDIQVNGGKVTVPLFPDRDLQKARDRAKKKSAVEDTSTDQLSKASSLSGREQPPL